MDSGNIAWMLTASALVLFMTPGLAFFYGGLVRGKNVVNMIMMSFMAMAVVGIAWILWGYSLAFGGANEFIGNFDYLGFKDVLPNIDTNGIEHVFDADGNLVETIDRGTIYSSMTVAIFQMMFAIITPALITGAVAERFKFKTYLIFLVLWMTFVYAPIAHWVWGDNGWIGNMGASDFAGGTVVHINAGLAAVAAVILVRKRRGVERGVEAHNVPYVVLGAAILWFGWFGFNAGSALAANGSAVNAFMVTNTAAAMAALTWVMLGYFTTGRASAVGAASGAVAGLVAITPAAGDVGAMGSLGIGLIAGALTWLTVRYRHLLRIDDALEVFAVHGVGGIVGALLTGVFAAAVLQGNAGVVDGEFDLLWANFRAVAATVGYSFGVTIVILMILDKVPGLGLRASESDEDNGLDISLHGERGYVGDGAD
ncbi:MAG: ammonium transporter [Chloroflexi bacterium]|nr:ammonium transporter [Chloroflexota bacterium]